MFYCGARVCDRNPQGALGGFTRKDHLVEHLRNFHHRDIPNKLGSGGLETKPKMSLASQAISTSVSQQAYDKNGYASTEGSSDSDFLPLGPPETPKKFSRGDQVWRRLRLRNSFETLTAHKYAVVRCRRSKSSGWKYQLEDESSDTLLGNGRWYREAGLQLVEE
jgi:hypothetical protein